MFRLFAVCASVFALLPTAAFADTFSVFQVQGTFQSGSSLSGTLTLDTTTGMFTASSLNNSYFPPTSQGFDASGRYFLIVSSNDPANPSTFYSFEYLRLPTLPSAGQTLQICSISAPCETTSGDESYIEGVSGQFGQYRTLSYLSNGQLTPQAGATPTPEPSSFLLLGTGMAIVGSAFRQRLFR